MSSSPGRLRPQDLQSASHATAGARACANCRWMVAESPMKCGKTMCMHKCIYIYITSVLAGLRLCICLLMYVYVYMCIYVKVRMKLCNLGNCLLCVWNGIQDDGFPALCRQVRQVMEMQVLQVSAPRCPRCGVDHLEMDVFFIVVDNGWQWLIMVNDG